MADTPGFPETNPVLFLDNRQRLFFLWPLIIAHRWETALMKYRISTDYQQPAGPPQWGFQDNIVLVPRNIEAKTKELAGTVPPGNAQMTELVARLVERAGDEYFSRMGWFTRTHPLQLPSGRILVPMYSDGFSFGIMGISDDGGLTWTGSEPIVGGGGVAAVRGAEERRHAGGVPARQRPRAEARADERVEGRWRVVDHRAGQRTVQSRNEHRGRAPLERALDRRLQRPRTRPALAGRGHLTG